MFRNILDFYLCVVLLLVGLPINANAHGEEVGIFVDISVCVAYIIIVMTRNMNIKVRLIMVASFIMLHGMAWAFITSSSYRLNKIRDIVGKIFVFIFRNESFAIISLLFSLILIFPAMMSIFLGYYYNKKRINQKAVTHKHPTTG